MKKLMPWLLSLLIVLVGFMTIYASVSNSRQSAAKETQLQLSSEIAAGLDSGQPAAVLIGSRVDIAKGLAPFTIIYDKKGNVVLGSGYLDNKVPKIDREVLNEAKEKPYAATTWSPKKDVKTQLVAVESKEYYVVSGRNLSEVDKAQSETLQIVLIGTIIAILLFGGVYVVSSWAEEY